MRLWTEGFKIVMQFRSEDYIRGGYYNVPRGVAVIAEESFKLREDLVKLTFPASVETVGVSAFERCENLESVNLSDVKKVYDKAFSRCENLTELCLTGVEYIHRYAFEACESLRKVYIQKGAYVHREAFRWCSPELEVVWCENDQIVGSEKALEMGEKERVIKKEAKKEPKKEPKKERNIKKEAEKAMEHLNKIIRNMD